VTSDFLCSSPHLAGDATNSPSPISMALPSSQRARPLHPQKNWKKLKDLLPRRLEKALHDALRRCLLGVPSTFTSAC